MPAGTRFAVALIVYTIELFGVIVPALVATAGATRIAVAIAGFTILLYATTTLIAVWLKDGDPRVVLFLYTGLLGSLTIVLSYPPLGPDAGWQDLLQMAVLCMVFVGVAAAGIHMASLIPRRNPIVIRHRWIIPGSYVACGALAAAAFVWELDAAMHFLPLADHAAPGVALRWILRGTYSLAGWLALYLYASAAMHDESTDGRRQAVVVFGGLLPWTLNATATLLVPGYARLPFYGLIEATVILLVPIAVLVSILRYRLFGLSVVVRRSLIYGGTTGLLTAALFIAGTILGELTARLVGIQPSIWWLAALFFIAGIFFRPLARRVGRRVDRAFFREKVELRRLQQTFIPELASLAAGGVAEHLVRRVRETLALRCATLLLADEAHEFYRVRATDGELVGGAAARGAVITSTDLGVWEALLAGGRAFARPDLPNEPAELREAMRSLSVEHIVPIRFRQLLVGLLLLGEPTKGWQLDADDLDALEVTAHQASAMLENARLLDMAVHDGLTGLPRVQFALERIVAEVERCRRNFRPFAVAMIDLDDFKRINDSGGHRAGDAALIALVERLRASSRSTDLLARYGGDEFVLFLPDTPASGAISHAESLRRDIELNERVTISIGLCLVTTPDDLADPGVLIERADEALYDAKRGGRNRIAAWPDTGGIRDRDATRRSRAG